ncbi:hypothetical protein [Streptomyces filamentosus]|uniref:hypothetical protein n=1 Tax=Streptomyces filamentosus TaxID=67294 RepID=UPI00123AF169|nr:hypothetical protein [Streptomyces filamentosus]KAA6211751.1 hypothetical protein CP979_35860 [Streptomyces filamentosus]KAA6220041.1 hypothetical protein CP979_26455 [Streptomyces filamentosus]
MSISITHPANFPTGDRRTVRVALPPVPVALVLVDRDGDVWRQVGVTKTGEPRMVCDSPSDSAEVGSGEADPWTPKAIRAWFSPVRTLGGAA